MLYLRQAEGETAELFTKSLHFRSCVQGVVHARWGQLGTQHEGAPLSLPPTLTKRRNPWKGSASPTAPGQIYWYWGAIQVELQLNRLLVKSLH